MASTSRPLVTFAILSSLNAAAGDARAQELIRVLDQDYWSDPDVVPHRLELLDDLDGDGLSEFLIGEPAFMHIGRVRVVSSASGQDLAAYSDPPLGVWDAAALGDVDGDGRGDFGAASITHPGGGMWIWSGRDYSLLHQDTSAVPASLTVADIGDVNSDGIGDVAYARGPIIVVAGGSFEELYVARPDAPAYIFGWRIVGLGDVDGDRVPDFAASAPFDPIFSIHGHGNDCFQAWIFVFSGIDGRQLYRIQGTPPCDFLGSGMAAPGDLNGDGVVDLAASSAFHCIRFFDGRNGELLGEACDEHQLDGFFGRVLEAVGDVNANGYGDILVRGNNRRELPINKHQGEAWLIDGGTREFLYRVTNPRSISVARYSGYAGAFTACGDWNDDGQPDLAIGAIPNSVQRGLIDVVSGHPRGVRSVEDSCARPAYGPRIGSSGIPVLGSQYRVHISQVPPGTRALLVVGNAVLGQTKGSFDDPGSGGGLTRCGLRVRPDHVIPAITAPAGGKNAAATAMVKIGRDPLLAGHRFYAQWILPKMRGASSTTRVLEITIQAELPPPYVP